MGVEAMAAERRECSRCGRSPLVGELLRVFVNRQGKTRAICETCIADSPGSALGDPVRVYRVGASERRLSISRAA